MANEVIVALAVLLIVCAGFAVALMLHERRAVQNRAEFVAAQVAAIEDMSKQRHSECGSPIWTGIRWVCPYHSPPCSVTTPRFD